MWKEKIKIIKDYIDVKVVLSIIGGILIGTGMPFEGFSIWIVSNLMWLIHFYKAHDKKAYMMYWVWQIQAVWGAIYWGFLH